VRATLDEIDRMSTVKGDLNIIDAGTGCGNIAVALAMSAKNTHIYASDISSDAIDIARMNVEKYKLQEQIELFCGDLFTPFDNPDNAGRIDIIVCNPPYIPSSTLHKLPPEVIKFEPVVALDAGPYGINIFRRLINDSIRLLKPDGVLLFEIGEGQERLVKRLFKKSEHYPDLRLYRIGDNVRVIRAGRMRENIESAGG
jgi:release factor glutamine methyltransferase